MSKADFFSAVSNYGNVHPSKFLPLIQFRVVVELEPLPAVTEKERQGTSRAGCQSVAGLTENNSHSHLEPT